METATRHLRLLSDVVAAATSTLELDEVLQRVASAIAAALETDACFVYELDAARGELVLGASVGSVPQSGPRRACASARASPAMRPRGSSRS